MLLSAVLLLLASPALQLCAAQATSVRLPSAGWEVTSDSQETRRANNVASNALDSDPSTIWHSRWSRNVPPLPHYLYIDMKGGPYNVSGLTYIPRQDGNRNGNIGKYRIDVYSASSPSGKKVASGKWADDASTKLVNFDLQTDVFAVKLKALTEAGRRGPWSSAAEVAVLGPVVAPECGTLFNFCCPDANGNIADCGPGLICEDGECEPTCGATDQECCEPGLFSGLNDGGCIEQGDGTAVCAPPGASFAGTCQPCGGFGDLCCGPGSPFPFDCAAGLSCEDNECEPTCGTPGEECCAPDLLPEETFDGCIQSGATKYVCAPPQYAFRDTCQPCGTLGELCCAYPDGPFEAGCAAGLSCEDSECEPTCGQPGEECCAPDVLAGQTVDGCIQSAGTKYVCAPPPYSFEGTCQPCGGQGDLCCGSEGPFPTGCAEGLSCEDSECEGGDGRK